MQKDANNKTLVSILEENAKHFQDTEFVKWINKDCSETDSLTYGRLWEESGRVVSLLQYQGVQPGDRIMVSYMPGLEFLAGLFGCMRAGAIACSAYPPNPKNAKHSFAQFNRQIADSGAKFALTTVVFRRLMMAAAVKGHSTLGVKWLATDKLKKSGAVEAGGSNSPEIMASDIAFIQYSSGSTSAPKGVIITHAAVVHNIGLIIGEKQRNAPRNVDKQIDTILTWCPQYHDYALVASFLHCVVSPSVKMVAFSPFDFIKNPLLWADALEKYNISITNGPNFAYNLLAKRLKTAGRSLNVRSLWHANIAAEPIAPKTLDAMVQIGIPKNAISPCYGMAECCAYVCNIGAKNIEVVDGSVSLGLVEEMEQEGTKILVADSESKEILAEGQEGELFLNTESLASGYWQNPVASEAFKALTINEVNYYATGDLGKIVNGRLFVSGRRKELIIINGKNIYPTDLERVIEAEYPDIIRPGSTVAFQATPDTAGVVLEIRNYAVGKMTEVTPSTICSLVHRALQVEVSSIYILKQGSVPKTTSGKLRRVEVKRRCLEKDWSPATILQLTKNKVISAESMQNKPKFDAILESVLGDVVDTTASWEENGLTSMGSVTLINALQDSYPIAFPVNILELYPTPALLKHFVLGDNTGSYLETNLRYLQHPKTHHLSWFTMGTLQVLGIVLLLLLFSVSIVPSWHIYQWLSEESTIIFRVGSRWLGWIWLPIALPAFLVSFSASIVLAKWVLVGQYTESEITVQSTAFLRWWWMDRALALWEFWVGRFIQDTLLIWLFYRMLGTKIHPSVRVKAFIREFDLISIGEGSKVHYPIRCKRFSPWIEGKEPMLHFRAIEVGQHCSIFGVLGPGSLVNDGARVERCSAVDEGGIVPSKALVKGSPALNTGQCNSNQGHAVSWTLEFMKVCWLVFEIYNFFALLLFAQMLFSGRLPSNWRYTNLCYWFLYISSAAIFSFIEMIPMKWILVGKRHPGPVSKSSLRQAALWASDYHFTIATMVVLSTTEFSSAIYSTFLKMMGMDIDYASKIGVPHFPPSVLDLVSIQQCLAPVMTVECEKDGQLFHTKLLDSSFGHRVHIDPNVIVSCKVVPPFSLIQHDMTHDTPDRRSTLYTMQEKIFVEMKLNLLYLILTGTVLLSLVPTYELWIGCFDPKTAEQAVPVMAFLLLVQTVIWIALLKALQYGALGFDGTKWQQGKPSLLHMLYLTCLWTVSEWSFISVLYGTPFFNAVARFLGSSFEGKGQALFFGTRIYEFPFISFADKTVIDGALISSHMAVGHEMTIGPVRLAGVVNEATFVSAGAVLHSNKETCPMHFVIDAISVDNKSDTSSSQVRREPYQCVEI